jgi:hypothetical protein
MIAMVIVVVIVIVIAVMVSGGERRGQVHRIPTIGVRWLHMI